MFPTTRRQRREAIQEVLMSENKASAAPAEKKPRFRVIDEDTAEADAKVKPKGKIADFRTMLIEKMRPKIEKAGGFIDTADKMELLSEPKTYVTTGIYALDNILSGGRGFPCGRFIEVFAPEGVGKSAMCEFMMGRFLKMGGTVHDIDTERTRDYDHLACYGVAKKDVIPPDLPDLEAVWDYLYDTTKLLKEQNAARAKAGMPPEPPNLIVLDSLAATPSRDELEEKEHDAKHMALQARSNAKGCRKTIRAFSAADAVFLCVNQIRDNPGAVGFQPKTQTPGGRAIKFAYSIRMKLALIETLKNKDDQPIGHVIEVTTVKNKHAPQKQTCEIVLSYLRGIDVPWSNFRWFQEHGLIQAKGRKGFQFEGSDEVFKRSQFGDFCRKNRKLVDKAAKACAGKDRTSLDDGNPDDAASDDDDG